MFQTKAARVLLNVRRTTIAVIEQKKIKLDALKAEIEQLTDPLHKLDLRVEVERQEAAIAALSDVLRYAGQTEAFAEENPAGHYELQARFLADHQTTLRGPVLQPKDLEPVTGERPNDLMAELNTYARQPFVIVAWTEWLDGDEYTTLYLVPQEKVLAYEVGWPTEEKPPWFRYKNLVSAIEQELRLYLDNAQKEANEAFQRMKTEPEGAARARAERDRDHFVIETCAIGRCIAAIRRIARWFQAE